MGQTDQENLAKTNAVKLAKVVFLMHKYAEIMEIILALLLSYLTR